MMDLLGKTQQALMRLLHEHKDGLTIFELADLLNVSRTAVKQHLVALQHSALVDIGKLDKSGGRPAQCYVLTSTGMELFPRQYSLFAKLLLETLQVDKKNSLKILFEKMGQGISKTHLPGLTKLRPAARMRKVATILTDLGYQAEIALPKAKQDLSRIEISNCVYHQLAIDCPEVCHFDKTLLEMLIGKPIEMQDSIIQGAAKCCFAVKK
jgi:DeoR family transcriptional regulator, suf operon transcriptional repressor